MGLADKITLMHISKAVILGLLLVAVGVFVWHEMPPELFNPVWIEGFLQQAGWLAPLFYMFLRVIAIMVTVVPNAPLDVAGGMLFGPFWGTVYALLDPKRGPSPVFSSPATWAGRRSPGCCTGISSSATASPGAIWHTSSCSPAWNRFSPLPW